MGKQTVYIPVDVKERLPDETGWYQCQYLADLKDFFWFNKNLEQFFEKGMKKAYGITHWLEKKENVHVFTEEEFEKVIGDAFDAGEKYNEDFNNRVSHTIYVNKTEYLNNLK